MGIPVPIASMVVRVQSSFRVVGKPFCQFIVEDLDHNYVYMVGWTILYWHYNASPSIPMMAHPDSTCTRGAPLPPTGTLLVVDAVSWDGDAVFMQLSLHMEGASGYFVYSGKLIQAAWTDNPIDENLYNSGRPLGRAAFSRAIAGFLSGNSSDSEAALEWDSVSTDEASNDWAEPSEAGYRQDDDLNHDNIDANDL